MGNISLPLDSISIKGEKRKTGGPKWWLEKWRTADLDPAIGKEGSKRKVDGTLPMSLLLDAGERNNCWGER